MQSVRATVARMLFLDSRETRNMLLALCLGLAAAIGPSQAMAASTALSFYDITHQNAGAEADGEAHLAVEVIDLGGSQVRFMFTNNSTSAITDVYFDDGTLLGISALSFSTGVSFAQGASPPNLPDAGNVSPGFQVTQGFLADSKSPVTKNGVSLGEWLAIDFTLLGGKTYLDTLQALALPNSGGPGDLRIGIRVQGFASGGSGESFINTPISAVPEGDSSIMLLAGLGVVGLMVRRRYA